MKLIEQIALWNREGNADKVYEVDLCEIAPERYVVNFRYGRRGAVLRDGTKTALPVPLAEAQKIMAQLVAEKKKGGYRETDHFQTEATTAPLAQSSAAVQSGREDKDAWLLRRLREALPPQAGDPDWPLHRIVWRVGERRLRAAAPLLMPLLLKGDALQQYGVCWALGRCGDPAAIPLLEGVYRAAASKDMVRRIALVAWLALEHGATERQALLHSIVQLLPPEWQLAWRADTDWATFLPSELSKKPDYRILEPLYLLATERPDLHAALLQVLREVPLMPDTKPKKGVAAALEPLPASETSTFRTLRHLFKIAEFREDAAVFGLLAYRLEQEKASFRFARYGREYGIFDVTRRRSYQNPATELKKPDSSLSFSNRTQPYFNRRAWRTLRTLGEDAQDNYVQLATAMLLCYSDAADRGKPVVRQKTIYQYEPGTGRYLGYTTEITHYDAYAKHWLFNHILYQNSPRYEAGRGKLAWRCRPGYQPGQTAPATREEAYPGLWDQQPAALVRLLCHSACEPVHDFAVKALEHRTDLVQWFDLDSLLRCLNQPYASTTRLSLHIARESYDPAKPDLDLLRLLAQHARPEAREMARGWVLAQPDFFIRHTAFVATLILTEHPDVQDWTRQLLAQTTRSATENQQLVLQCLADLLALPADAAAADTRAAAAAQTLAEYLMPTLRGLHLDVAQDLLASPVPNVQTLGAIILLNHVTPPEQLPAGLLASLIQSPTPQVRQAGVRLFGRLPEQQLLENYPLLAAFCVSPYPEIRQAVAPIVQDLAGKNAPFGQNLLAELLPYLSRREAYEGLHEDLFHLFVGPLERFQSGVPRETALQLLLSSHSFAQQYGFTLLQKNIPPEELSVRQIIWLANHEMLGVRRYAWQIFSDQVPRMQAEAGEAIRLLDARWEDSRTFAIEYFRHQFSDAHWSPQVLVSVCDSTREEVQAFGRELITKFFQEENGPEYLLQLSQHPSQRMQHFATHYLEQYASDQPGRIAQLQGYFITILSQVNKGSVSKNRVLHFLRTEGLKSETLAQLVADILSRQSATLAVADKAACIRILRDLQAQFPAIESPLVPKPVTARTAQTLDHAV
ncbi:MAG: hypothetical protein IT260_09725 [Saprospiraceae bacterium]|nr:hypothetical protein [Saprospiraceae bacterium]